MSTPPVVPYPHPLINCRCVTIPIVPEWKWRFYRSRGIAYGRLVDPFTGDVSERVQIRIDKEVSR